MRPSANAGVAYVSSARSLIAFGVISPPGATTTTAPGLAREEDVAVGRRRRREVRPGRAGQPALLDHGAGVGIERVTMPLSLIM